MMEVCAGVILNIPKLKAPAKFCCCLPAGEQDCQMEHTYTFWCTYTRSYELPVHPLNRTDLLYLTDCADADSRKSKTFRNIVT